MAEPSWAPGRRCCRRQRCRGGPPRGDGRPSPWPAWVGVVSGVGRQLPGIAPTSLAAPAGQQWRRGGGEWRLLPRPLGVRGLHRQTAARPRGRWFQNGADGTGGRQRAAAAAASGCSGRSGGGGEPAVAAAVVDAVGKLAGWASAAADGPPRMGGGGGWRVPVWRHGCLCRCACGVGWPPRGCGGPRGAPRRDVGVGGGGGCWGGVPAAAALPHARSHGTHCPHGAVLGAPQSTLLPPLPGLPPPPPGPPPAPCWGRRRPAGGGMPTLLLLGLAGRARYHRVGGGCAGGPAPPAVRAPPSHRSAGRVPCLWPAA